MYDMFKPADKSFINMQSNTVLNKVYSKNDCVYHKNLFPEYLKIKKEKFRYYTFFKRLFSNAFLGEEYWN